MDYKEVGYNIKYHRKQAGLTQKELAKAINRTESSVQKYEKGEVEIPNSILEKIADVLSLPIGFLLPSDPIEWPPELKRGYLFWEYVESLGYRVVIDEGLEEDSYYLEYKDGTAKKSYIIHPGDLLDIVDEAEAFVRFKLNEEIKKLKPAKR